MKGKPVLCEGRIQVSEYQDKAGQRKWSTDVVVKNLILLSSGNREQSHNAAPSREYAPTLGQDNIDSYADDFPLDMSDFGDDGGEYDARDVDVPF
jgi:single-strand DNA-binding protein